MQVEGINMIQVKQSEQYFLCDCMDRHHIMSVSYFLDDDDWPWVSVDMHVYKGNLFNRIGLAIRYILGISTEYGHWHEILLDHDDVARLIKHLQIKQAPTVEIVAWQSSVDDD